ncbi:MAG: MBL fold metallo-hydrolase [Lachnospiraceae bacterium]|nr:MBL fold metallo-hydrolase [Lachnospiraceae bacterium]
MQRGLITKILAVAVSTFLFAGSVGIAVTEAASSPKKTLDKETEETDDTEEAKEPAVKTTNRTKAATDITAKKNKEMYDILDFDDKQEYEFATKGLIDAPEELEITNEDGLVMWSQKAYDFLDDADEIPDSANPSLWQNCVNNHAYGLFEVTDGIYQVRGYDMANVTFVEGDTGWIIFDTAMTENVASAAKDLVDKNLGKKPIKAVIMSHPHVDHFGGIKAFMSDSEKADSDLDLQEQADSGKIPVIVPEGFTEHAMEENLYAGTAMSRRAQYQYGVMLDKGEKGALSIGIGQGQSRGNITFIVPTYEVKETGEKVTIDGIDIEFQMTPGTEAPAEMNAYLPQKKALWLAENCTGTLHNLYTLRGAEVRDGNAWAEYIMEAVALFGDKTEVTFQAHNWPHWGKDVVKDYMINTAAVYKYINDETLSRINSGETSTEIANTIKLPKELAKNWYTRQYYGTVAHDSKAVYQKYMGWYDANPINLGKLTPEETAKKWAEYLELGGKDAAMKKALEEFDEGEYQWVAEFTNMMVFADPDDEDARNLCADALEQLGYQAESGTWRNCYLTAALELRKGNQTGNIGGKSNFASDLMQNLTPEMAFDYMGILLDKDKASDDSYTIEMYLKDTKETYTLCLRYGALLYAKGTIGEKPDATVECPSKALALMLSDPEEILDKSEVSGDEEVFNDLIENLSKASGGQRGNFNIIEP